MTNAEREAKAWEALESLLSEENEPQHRIAAARVILSLGQKLAVPADEDEFDGIKEEVRRRYAER
jgi:hypothetical protein